MDDAVTEYRKRRQKRLDAKAVEQYRIRRDARINGRMDADGDDENSNNGGGKRGGGHGNTKLPFGLCQREGIKIDPKWTPSDAWGALEGKGYSAGEVYKEIKTTGKVSKKGSTKTKKPPTRIEESHFLPEMTTKTYRKNTMAFADYVSEHCDDGNITEFFSSAVGDGAKRPSKFAVKRLSGADGACVAYTRDLREIDLNIPNFSSIKDESTKAQAIRTFAHEYTHLLDMFARGEHGDHFTGMSKKIEEELDKAKSKGVGEEAAKVFRDYNEVYDKMKEDYAKKERSFDLDYAKEKFGDNFPEWLKEDGSWNYSLGWRAWESYKPEMKKYQSVRKKAAKELAQKESFNRRKLMDGATNLQGIYDSIFGGELRDKKVVRYGHSLKYFRDDKENRAVEAIADYVALKATSSKYADMFVRDHPGLASAFDDAIVEMTKVLRGAK